MKPLSENSLNSLKKCLSLLKDNRYSDFENEVNGVGDFSRMVQKDRLLESPKLGKFLYSSLPKNKVEINAFSAIVSCIVNSERMTAVELKKFVKSAGYIDPLEPAFIAHAKKGSVVKTNLEMMMSVNDLPLDIFLDHARYEGMISNRKEQYEKIMESVVNSQLDRFDRLEKIEIDQFGRQIVWKNLLICAFNNILPSESLMQRSVGAEGKNSTALKFSYPWRMPNISILNDGPFSAVNGKLAPIEVGVPLIAFAASTNGASILISDFLNKGHDVNQSNPQNLITALHVSAERGDIKCAHKLITAGANIDARDSMGRTPTQYIELYKDGGGDKKMKTMQEFQALFDARRAMDAIDSIINNLTNSARLPI